MKCEDCNDNGWIVLAYTRTKCDACDGTGEMDPEVNPELGSNISSIMFDDAIPMPIWDDDTEPLYELGIVIDDDRD